MPGRTQRTPSELVHRSSISKRTQRINWRCTVESRATAVEICEVRNAREPRTLVAGERMGVLLHNGCSASCPWATSQTKVVRSGRNNERLKDVRRTQLGGRAEMRGKLQLSRLHGRVTRAWEIDTDRRMRSSALTANTQKQKSGRNARVWLRWWAIVGEQGGA